MNRRVNPQPRERVSQSIHALIKNLGFQVDGGMSDTPERVAKAYETLLSGYDANIEEILSRNFDTDDDPELTQCGYQGIVMLSDIELYSLCEHHMLPFVGRAHVAYIPNESGRVVGISKLARLVDAYARRLQVQERLTLQVAQAIENHLQPKGVAVVIQAEHFCIRMRGVGKQNSVMTTSQVMGGFKDCAATRDEFFRLLGLSQKGLG